MGSTYNYKQRLRPRRRHEVDARRQYQPVCTSTDADIAADLGPCTAAAAVAAAVRTNPEAVAGRPAGAAEVLAGAGSGSGHLHCHRRASWPRHRGVCRAADGIGKCDRPRPCSRKW